MLYVICHFRTTGRNPRRDLPLEVGLVCCNGGFGFLTTYTSLIKWPVLMGFQDWPETWGRDHGLEFQVLMQQGKWPGEVVTDIRYILQLHSSCGLPTLVSEDILSDYSFMLKLFEGSEFPFRSRAYDPGLLFEVLQELSPLPLPDPREGGALEAALNTYRRMRKALDVLSSRRALP